MNTGQTLFFRPRRRRIIGLLLVSIAFLCAGSFAIRAGHSAGWLLVTLVGVVIAVCILQLLPQSTYLCIGPNGFTRCTLFRARTCRWSDVGPFKVVRVGTKAMV